MAGPFERWTRWIVPFAVAGVVLFAAVFMLLRSPPEPRCEGRSLTEWFRSSQLPEKDSFGYPLLNAEGVAAVRHIGSNGVPFYLRWIRLDPDKALIVNKPPSWMPKWARNIMNSVYGRDEERAVYALMGFRSLGPDAAGAIPPLTKMMLAREKGVPVAFLARFALAYLGKDALEPLAGVLTNAPSFDQINIAMALSGMSYLGTDALPVIPILAQSTTSSVYSVRVESTRALGCFRLEPARSIPALTNCLRSTDFEVRYWAAWSLGQFGSRARDAAPILVRSLTDTNKQVRQHSFMALFKIAPEWFPTNQFPTNQVGYMLYPIDKGIGRFLQAWTNQLTE